MANLVNWRRAFFELKAAAETKFKNSCKFPAVSQKHFGWYEMARELTRTAVINRSVDQVLSNALQTNGISSFLLCRGGGRDVTLGAGSPVVEWLEIMCWLLTGAIYVLPAYSKAAATHPGRVCPLFLHRVQMPKVNGGFSPQPLSYLWDLQLQHLASVDVMTSKVSFLAYFSLSHYSATDRNRALSLSLWNLPLWTSIGRSFQGLHSCTLSVTSFWHQNFTSFSFSSCQLHLMKSALCRAVLPCLHFDDS